MNCYLRLVISAVSIVIWAGGCTSGKGQSAAVTVEPTERPRMTPEPPHIPAGVSGKAGKLFKVVRYPRIEQMADVLVGYSVEVKKGDMVVIFAPPMAEPLVVALFKAILEAGDIPTSSCSLTSLRSCC